MSRSTVLIVDDEAAVRFAMRDFLETHGYVVEEAQTCQQAQAAFQAGAPDVAILDYSLPDGTALDLLPRLKASDPEVPLVILTGLASIELAVRAIKEGAEHFLTKPVELPALRVVLERLLENRRIRHRHMARRSKASRRAPDPFLGESAAIRRLADDARRFLSSDSPVLIRGETGSGKGVLAAWLHQNGPRAEEAFVDLNCASLSKDLLESELFGYEKGAFTGAASAKPGLLDVAHRGSLFLDEIGDADPSVQPKLLKVLEEKRYRRLGDVRDRQVDVRLIAATHQDLGRAVRENRFRSDLYYRISTIPLVVPPLRERLEDLERIADDLLQGLAADLGRGPFALAPDALAALRAYAWPGNIRELRNVLERAALLADGRVLGRRELRFESPGLPEDGVDEASLTLEEVERRHIERVLTAERGHVEAAARRLGIPRSTLYQRIKQLGLSVPRS
jgi:DNA-binding NtrC family response regulator